MTGRELNLGDDGGRPHPPEQPQLPSLREVSPAEQRSREYIHSIGRDMIFGRQSPGQVFEGVMNLAEDDSQRRMILSQLRLSEQDQMEYVVVLKTIACSQHLGLLDATLDALQSARQDGNLPTEKMRDLLLIGVEFSQSTRRWSTEDIAQMKRDIGYIDAHAPIEDTLLPERDDDVGAGLIRGKFEQSLQKHRTFLPMLSNDWLIGRVSFSDKLERLISSQNTDVARLRVLDELDKSMHVPQDYAAVLQTLDYAQLRGMLNESLNALSSASGEGEVDIGLMNELVRVGVPFNRSTMKWDMRNIEFQQDILLGGTGYGPDVRIKDDIPYIRTKTQLRQTLRRWEITELPVKDEGMVPVEKAPEPNLRARYLEEYRRRRGEERRQHRMLDQI